MQALLLKTVFRAAAWDCKLRYLTFFCLDAPDAQGGFSVSSPVRTSNRRERRAHLIIKQPLATAATVGARAGVSRPPRAATQMSRHHPCPPPPVRLADLTRQPAVSARPLTASTSTGNGMAWSMVRKMSSCNASLSVTANTWSPAQAAVARQSASSGQLLWVRRSDSTRARTAPAEPCWHPPLIRSAFRETCLSRCLGWGIDKGRSDGSRTKTDKAISSNPPVPRWSWVSAVDARRESAVESRSLSPR